MLSERIKVGSGVLRQEQRQVSRVATPAARVLRPASAPAVPKPERDLISLGCTLHAQIPRRVDVFGCMG